MKLIVAAAVAFAFALPPAAAGDAHIMKRGTLENSRLRFQTGKRGHVVFMGGSITEMDGYRPMVCEMLRKRFPETEFTFTNAGIASTCSTTGAFRLQDDVLARGPVDLLLVEFAVNDDQDAHHTRTECLRGMEGIVRHLRRHNPRADLVIVYFVNEHLMAQYRKGETPLPIAAHEEVAAHYQLSTVNLCEAVTARMDAGEFDWKKFGGVHPAPFGNRIAAEMVGQLFDECWKEALPAGAAAKDYPMPARPLDESNYGGGRFLDPKEAKLSADWQVHVPDWARLPGGKRDRFTKLPMLEGTKPGASLTLDFAGTAIGAYILAGPEAGAVEASVDGAPAAKVDLWHSFSAGLHYPRTVLFADALAPGKHTLALKISAEKNTRSKGTAVRVMQFVVNEVLTEAKPPRRD
jgi:lysophospholipase L1-like esterase